MALSIAPQLRQQIKDVNFLFTSFATQHDYDYTKISVQEYTPLASGMMVRRIMSPSDIISVSEMQWKTNLKDIDFENHHVLFCHCDADLELPPHYHKKKQIFIPLKGSAVDPYRKTIYLNGLPNVIEPLTLHAFKTITGCFSLLITEK